MMAGWCEAPWLCCCMMSGNWHHRSGFAGFTPSGSVRLNKICPCLQTRALCEVPRYGLQLLPYYARIAASLSQVFPDIGQGKAPCTLKSSHDCLSAKPAAAWASPFFIVDMHAFALHCVLCDVGRLRPACITSASGCMGISKMICSNCGVKNFCEIVESPRRHGAAYEGGVPAAAAQKTAAEWYRSPRLFRLKHPF